MRDLRCLTVFQVLLLLAIGATTATLTLWWTDRDPPVTVLSARPDTFAMADGPLTITYEVERHKSCPVHVDRTIITSDGVRLALADMDWSAAPGPMGRDTYKDQVPIPKGTEAGPATFRSIAAYRCNLLQHLFPVIVRSEVRFVVAR